MSSVVLIAEVLSKAKFGAFGLCACRFINMNNEKLPKIDGKEFKKRRMALNISQNDFASTADISYRTIIRLEQGKTISGKLVHKIVHALKKLESKPKTETLWWKSHKNNL